VGRPRRYDENELLDAAQELFWVRGYDRTSVEDIAAASGVATSSLYAAYGTKRGLFLRVFRRYCDGRVALVAGAVDVESDDSVGLLRDFLAAVVDDCLAHPDRRGCLMLTSLADLRDRIPEVEEIAAGAVASMKVAVTDSLLRTAHAAGRHVRVSDARERAARAVLASQAVLHLSRLPLTRARLMTMGEALLPT